MSKRRGTVGLITGCFDVLHIGHIKLFKWAKKRVDLLIVGLDSNGSIVLSKGIGQPVFKQSIRAEVISGLSSVDLVFKIRKIFSFGDPSAESYHTDLIKTIRPDFLITHATRDVYVKNKLERAKKHGIGLLLYKEPPPTSSTEIVEKIRRLD